MSFVIKSKFVLFVFLAGVAACIRPNVESKEGGVNGGGGGTLPANPITVGQAVDIIREQAKADLQAYVKYRQYGSFESTDSDLEKRFFAGSPNLWDVLNTTDIEVRTRESCRDYEGVEVDGSIHHTLPNAICISAFRVAPKLIIERARVEIESLIIHELGHLLGASEKEARALQSDAAFYLSEIGGRKATGREFFEKLQEGMEDLSHHLWDLDDIRSKTDEQILQALDAVSDRLTNVHDLYVGTTQAALSKPEAAYFFLQMSRLRLLEMYQRGQSDPRMADFWLKKYDEAFAGADQTTFGQYLANTHMESIFGGHIDNEIMTKVKDRNGLMVEIKLAQKYFRRFEKYSRQLRFGTRPDRLPPMSNVANPWAQFEGTYTVSKAVCTSGSKDDTTGFTIGIDAELGEYKINRTWRNGWGDYGGLYDGADVLSMGSVFVDGNSDWAMRTSENHNRWGSQSGHGWMQLVLKIEKSESDFVMTETHTSRGWSGVLSDRVSTCTYSLIQN